MSRKCFEKLGNSKLLEEFDKKVSSGISEAIASKEIIISEYSNIYKQISAFNKEYGIENIPSNVAALNNAIKSDNERISVLNKQISDLELQKSKIPTNIQSKKEAKVAVDDLKQEPVQLKIDFDTPFTKAELTDSQTNLYHKDGFTVDDWNKLPFKQIGNYKYAYTDSESYADELVAKYNGVKVFTPTADKRFKVSIQMPLDVNDLISEPVEIPEQIREVVNRKKNRIQAFRTKLAAKTPRAAEIKASIHVLESQIKSIEENYTKGILNNIASNDAITIANNLKIVEEKLQSKDLTDKELLDLMDILIENSYNIKGWLDIVNIVTEEFTDKIEEVDKLSGTFNRQNKKYVELTADVYLRYINQKTFNNNFTKESLLSAVSDVDKGTIDFLTISKSNIPLLQTADDLIKDIAFKIDEEFIKKKSEIRKFLDNLIKSTGKTRNELKEMFKQYDEKGNWTGNYIGRYKQEYYNERKSRAEEAKKTDNWKPYYKWLRENSTEISHEQLLALDKMSIEDINNLPEENAMGEFSRDELIHQKQLLEQYHDFRTAQMQILQTNSPYNIGELIEVDGKLQYTSSNPEIEFMFYEEMENWEMLNNPFRYAKTTKREGMRGYLYTINAHPKDKWLDSKYREVQSNPELYEFYKYMRSTIKEGNSYLPYFNDLQDNYMPEVQKTLISRIKEQNGVKNKMSLLGNEMKVGLTDELVSTESNDIVIGGKVRRSVPVYMMSNRLDAINKEDDIFTVLEEYSKMYLNYKYKAEIEPMANAAMDLLETVDELQTVDVNGKPTPRMKYGFIDKRPGQLINAKEGLQFTIDAHLYNINAKVQGRTGKKLTTKDETGKEVKREFTWSKFADFLNSISFYKTMSFPNVVLPMVNSAFGMMSNATYASGLGRKNEFLMAESLLKMSSISSTHLGAKVNKELAMKTYVFMNRFHLLGDVNDGYATKGFGEMVTYLQTKAEFFNQGSLMLFELSRIKLLDKDGNEVSVFDAYNEVDGQLVWNTELMGEQQAISSDTVISEDKRQVNLLALSNHINEVNHIVHGNYKDPMKIKQGAGWRLVMLYKRWIPEAINHRFGSYKENKDLMNDSGKRGMATKGRYLSMFSAKTKDGIDVSFIKTMGLMLTSMINKQALGEMSEVDRVNLLRNMREFQYMAMIYGAVAILQGVFAGDDDKDSTALKLAINALSKTQSDMMFFINPNSANQLLDNVIPAAAVLADMVRCIDSIGKIMVGDTYYKNGPWKDHNRLTVNTMRLFPFTSSGVKMYNYGTRIFDYN